MQRYEINYFDEKSVGYFGTLEGAIEYAESFARNLVLTCRGDVAIADCDGRIVARQRWTRDGQGRASPSVWE